MSSPWIASNCKPLSVNEATIGKKVKSKAYRMYEEFLIEHLPNVEVPDGELELQLMVFYPSRRSDLDNALKPFIDVLQKRYGFNDNRIDKLVVIKRIDKENPRIVFRFKPYNPGS